MMRGNQGSDSGWQMDSAGERHGGHVFPTLPSTDTTRGEVGGDKGQRPTIQWTTGLYDASSSWLCLCLAWRALKQGGEPILAASMSKTGPGEELRLHGMRRSPALVVTRGGPGQGWAGPKGGPLVGVVIVHGEEAIHHHTFWCPRPLNPLLASSVSSRRLQMRQQMTEGRRDGDFTPSSVAGHDDEPPLGTTRSARGRGS